MNPIHVQLCGYHQHPESFRQHFPGGLETYIIRLQFEGVSQALVSGGYASVEPGDLMLFKPGDLYDLRIEPAKEPTKASGDYFIMSTGPGMDEWWASRQRPTKVRIAEDGKLIAQWHQLMAEKRRLDGGDPPLVTLLAQTLLLMLDRAIGEAPSARSSSAFHAIRMRNYIEANASRPLRLEDVARDCGLSVSRAVHLFKEHYGTSVIGYAQQIRMAHALELLHHSPLSLEQIAAETGLGSYAYFHRIFRAQHGLSPGAYRKKHAAKGLRGEPGN
ncbi:helix-turn-helix domain-containing protein [Cohnella sp. GCM10027633]|uniref:helix-turn-helix domain-containing protein n=1 Tax=unclassified Cohnella TaxID=2636738 RepID=UPI003638640C